MRADGSLAMAARIAEVLLVARVPTARLAPVAFELAAVLLVSPRPHFIFNRFAHVGAA